MKMTYLRDVVNEISPLFGDYESDFNVGGIASEMVEFTGDGYVFRPVFDPDCDDYDEDAVNELLEKYRLR